MAKSSNLASLIAQRLDAWALRLGADDDHLFAFDETGGAGGFPPDPIVDRFLFLLAQDPAAGASSGTMAGSLAMSLATSISLEAPDAIPPALGSALGDSLVFKPDILAAAIAQIVDLPPTAPGPEFVLNLAGEVVAAVSTPDGSDHALLSANGFVPSDPGAVEQAASASQSGPSGGWLIERDGSARFVEDIFAERASVQVPPGQQYSALDPLL